MIRNSFNPRSVLLESFRALGCERIKRLPPWRNMKNVDENTNGNLFRTDSSMRYCQRSRKRMKWDNGGYRYGSASLFQTAYGYYRNTDLNARPHHPSFIPHYPRLSRCLILRYPYCLPNHPFLMVLMHGSLRQKASGSHGRAAFCSSLIFLSWLDVSI